MLTPSALEGALEFNMCKANHIWFASNRKGYIMQYHVLFVKRKFEFLLLLFNSSSILWSVCMFILFLWKPLQTFREFSNSVLDNLAVMHYMATTVLNALIQGLIWSHQREEGVTISTFQKQKLRFKEIK